MTQHTFMVTFDTETSQWIWDTEQEGERLDGLTLFTGIGHGYDQVGANAHPVLFDLEDSLAERLGLALKLLNGHEKDEPVMKEVVPVARVYPCTLRVPVAGTNEYTMRDTKIGVIPYGFKGDSTEELIEDDDVFYWCQADEFYEGAVICDGWVIAQIEAGL